MNPLLRNLALWAQATGISRADYVGLREVLQGPCETDSIQTLPRKLDTLKVAIYGQI